MAVFTRESILERKTLALEEKTGAPKEACRSAILEADFDMQRAEKFVYLPDNKEILKSLNEKFKIEEIKVSESILNTSTNGDCPQCQSQDWKLAKMMYLSGVTTVKIRTEGSGSEVGFGFGRGRGGLDFTSSSYEENALGLQQSEISRVCSPPTPPKLENTKQQLLEEMKSNLRERNMTERGKENTGFFSLSKKDLLAAYDKKIEKILHEINEWDRHEKKMLIWEKTKVCQRCGTQYLDLGNNT